MGHAPAMQDRTSARLEMDELIQRQTAGAPPSEADKERFQALMNEIVRDDPLTQNLKEAYQLVEAVAPPCRGLSVAEKSNLVAALAIAGDDKIELFSAMARIGQSTA